MRGAPHLLLIGTYLILVGVAVVIWRRGSNANCVLQWRGRHGLLAITITWKDLRIYRSRWPVVLADDTPTLTFNSWRWPFRPFSNERAPADTTHHAWGGLLYARGEHSETRTRYRVVSVPHWLPVFAAIAALTPFTVRTMLAILPAE